MVDIRGAVLYKILSKEEGSLDAWSKLKLGFFGTEYAGLYRAMSKFYINHTDLPSFEDLELHNRNALLKVTLVALRDIEVVDVSLDLTVEALINEYTQEETLKELDAFVDEITYYSAPEIKEQLGEILLNIEERTLSSEEVVFMNEISVVTEQELLNLMPLGLNNTFDAQVGGMAPTEFLALGGMRGSGKSGVCTNLAINQYEMGNTVVYFTIEMRAKEIFDRQIALLADVPLSHITKATLTGRELEKIAKVRSEMFIDAEGLYTKYQETRDYNSFEKELNSTKALKENNQLIIVDSPALTLSSIALTIQKFKAKFGDKLKLVVVDYLNQINVPNKYNWDVQIETSAQLKGFARKNEIILCAPYQIDNTGEARFSKGILDSADISMILDKTPGRIDFTSTKTRNMGAFEFASAFNEQTLKIIADDSKLPPKQEAETKSKKPKPAKDDTEKEESSDMPW